MRKSSGIHHFHVDFGPRERAPDETGVYWYVDDALDAFNRYTGPGNDCYFGEPLTLDEFEAHDLDIERHCTGRECTGCGYIACIYWCYDECPRYAEFEGAFEERRLWAHPNY